MRFLVTLYLPVAVRKHAVMPVGVTTKLFYGFTTASRGGLGETLYMLKVSLHCTVEAAQGVSKIGSETMSNYVNVCSVAYSGSSAGQGVKK